MTIATKNGSVILKDGSVAQNCGCCGAWYCCPDTQCLQSFPQGSKATIQITASENFLRQARTQVTWSDGRQTVGAVTQIVVLSPFNGTHTLEYSSDFFGWLKDFGGGRRILVRLTRLIVGVRMDVSVVAAATNFYTNGYEQYRDRDTFELNQYSTGSTLGTENFVENRVFSQAFGASFGGSFVCGTMTTTSESVVASRDPLGTFLSGDGGQIAEDQLTYSDPVPISITIYKPFVSP